MRTLVVDITYRCNSPCLYCQWGSPQLRKPDRVSHDVCLSSTALDALGVEKVVFSGGEPALHPELTSILEHYAARVSERVVITNGLLLDGNMRSRLLAAGATGFTFSIDSLDPLRFEANRGLPTKSLATILGNLREAAENRDFGLGLNAVVTSATASVTSVRDLLTFAAGLRLDFVKFAPVFDDGYVGQTAPHLRLSRSDACSLNEIATFVETTMPLPSNPPGFWRDLAALACGERLHGANCGIGRECVLLVPERLARCYWVPSADVGPVDQVTFDDANRSVKTLEFAKPSCLVGAHCFCLQAMDHEWA